MFRPEIAVVVEWAVEKKKLFFYPQQREIWKATAVVVSMAINNYRTIQWNSFTRDSQKEKVTHSKYTKIFVFKFTQDVLLLPATFPSFPPHHHPPQLASIIIIDSHVTVKKRWHTVHQDLLLFFV